MNPQDLIKRKDVPALEWSSDLLKASPHPDLALGSYKIQKVFGGYRILRGKKDKSSKLKKIEDCQRAISADYTAKFLRTYNAPRSPWLPMQIAPNSGWGFLARMRGDLASFLDDHRYTAWAQKQIVIRVSRLNDMPESASWDMCAPSGVEAIPSEWFTGWRPLACPLPVGKEDMPLLIAAA